MQTPDTESYVAMLPELSSRCGCGSLGESSGGRSPKPLHCRLVHARACIVIVLHMWLEAHSYKAVEPHVRRVCS
jgi:hypothetical protein